MAQQQTTPTVGSYVQYTSVNDAPDVNAPSGEEQGLGIVRQVLTDKGEPYYQVVWNPGSARPKVGMYHQNQLTVLNQQQATNIINQMNSGSYTPNTGQQGSNYQSVLPQAALPPSLQGS